MPAKIHVTVTPAYLGWSNPEVDGTSLRLYATDKDNAPRWSKDSPTGRTAEFAASEDGAVEGERYLIVRLGDRFIPDAAMAAVQTAIELAAPVMLETALAEIGPDEPITVRHAAEPVDVPSMTVDRLRERLVGVPGDLEVLVHASDPGENVTVFAALKDVSQEEGCDGTEVLRLMADGTEDAPS